MTDELETMTANLKKARGFIADVQIAADKLPLSETVDDLRDSVEATLNELDWALHYLAAVAKQGVPA